MAKELHEYKVEAMTVEGVKGLRIAGSQFFAIRNKRRWDVISLEPREYVCQLLDKEVYSWLRRAARSEELERENNIEKDRQYKQAVQARLARRAAFRALHVQPALF